ncbi:hypothetical protein RFI_18918 [Reticulomyxa filosa]|uniref:Uncharacterized protein n=1 Tax=Reticulomyxa filosa TaxID=46433 RepID=X6MWI6_RETFI|nr:hypothetical protein RFI_18918 [Reticulomyxa filosa]|eukprot:ETO18358.1 hypothetical protein RFI_18918 [Reticulomyxa filosa]
MADENTSAKRELKRFKFAPPKKRRRVSASSEGWLQVSQEVRAIAEEQKRKTAKEKKETKVTKEEKTEDKKKESKQQTGKELEAVLERLKDDFRLYVFAPMEIRLELEKYTEANRLTRQQRLIIYANTLDARILDPVLIAKEKLQNPFQIPIEMKTQVLPKYAIPIFLKSQMYGLLPDRTLVDQCLHYMKRNNILRHFQFKVEPISWAPRQLLSKTNGTVLDPNLNIEKNTSVVQSNPTFGYFCDNGILDCFCFTTDLQFLLQHKFAELMSLLSTDKTTTTKTTTTVITADDHNNNNLNGKKDQTPLIQHTLCDNHSNEETTNESVHLDHQRWLTAFVSQLLPKHCDCTISEAQLLEHLSVDPREPNAKDAITFLINCGLIIASQKHKLYNFTFPNASSIITYVRQARKEMVSILRKKKYFEMPKDEFIFRKLKSSPLGALFHFRDLLGLNVIQEVLTASGTIVKLC